MLLVLYLFINFLAFIGILIETFSYSGFIRSNFMFDIRILILISIFIAILNLILKNHNLLPTLIIKINNLILLPLSAIITILFTLLELINYPNYVFSNFHLNYDSLIYLFLISFSIFIFTFDKKRLNNNCQQNIFGLSIILLIIFSIIRTWPGGIFFIITREDKLIENLQFIFYFFSALLALYISLKYSKSKNKLGFIYFLGFSLFLFFIAGEEISWGQRILNINSPQIAKELNTQSETTIHNIRGLNDLQPIMYLIFSFYLTSAWMIIKTFPIKLQKKIYFFVPHWHLMLYFLPIFIFYTHINILGGNHWEWQEACELMLSIGLFIFMFENVTRKKIKE